MTMVFANYPVRDLLKSTDFYSKLGFKKNEMFSTDDAVAMMWDDNFWIMLLTHDFYKKFINGKDIADTQKTSGALIAFSLNNVEAVHAFAKAAKDNGGDYYSIDMGIPEDQMVGYEVVDLDGNIMEPSWMAK